MANRTLAVIKYLTLPTLVALALMQIAKPNEEELKKIKNYSQTNDQFSAVLKAAANPNAKPIYRQKPGEQHPLLGATAGTKSDA